MTDPRQERDRLNRTFDEADPRPQPPRDNTSDAPENEPDSAWEETAQDLKSGFGNIKDRAKDTIDDLAQRDNS